MDEITGPVTHSKEAKFGGVAHARAFRDDDAGYLAWLAAHADRYVINIGRSHSATQARVRHATCRTIGVTTHGGTRDVGAVECGDRSGDPGSRIGPAMAFLPLWVARHGRAINQHRLLGVPRARRHRSGACARLACK
jgi:hypothetical protein